MANFPSTLHRLRAPTSHLTSTRRGNRPKKREVTPSASATKDADLRKPGESPPNDPGTLFHGSVCGAAEHGTAIAGWSFE